MKRVGSGRVMQNEMRIITRWTLFILSWWIVLLPLNYHVVCHFINYFDFLYYFPISSRSLLVSSFLIFFLIFPISSFSLSVSSFTSQVLPFNPTNSVIVVGCLFYYLIWFWYGFIILLISCNLSSSRHFSYFLFLSITYTMRKT